MPKVRITVLKKVLHKDLVKRYERITEEVEPDGYGICEMWPEGHEFLIEDWPKRPADFGCDWAWRDIQRIVAIMMFGGSLPWMANPDTAVTCCSDGFRPVTFLIERIGDEED